MTSNAQHCSFVLLAEFDIDRGAQLTYQFPQPLGTDEGLLANLMLPDGAEKQLEDWTIFFLNQTSFNTIAPVLALEEPESNGNFQGEAADRSEILYVLNLVRTKHDKSVRRGAVVKAMAICTRHPFIQIFKPVLLMALDDYYSDPSQDALARLFDAVNSMDISGAPLLTRQEKIIMRSVERKDVFAEKFKDLAHSAQTPAALAPKAYHRTTNSQGSHSSFEDGIVVRKRERAGTASSVSLPQPAPSHSPPEDSSFSLGGSAVWVGDESELDTTISSSLQSTATVGTASSVTSAGSSTTGATSRGRKSTDASSSSSSHGLPGKDNNGYGVVNMTSGDTHYRAGIVKDTHFFQTTIAYKGHQLPIKMPLSTFPEEVGDYSLIQLIQTLSNPAVIMSGPLHPHLHTNGSLTHPVMILFNALVTGKRIIFLGHNRPAGQVSSYVLSACALGSGCGTVLRGFIERAFPYANLTNRDEWESVPAYIAGVCNPIFETSGSWDLLFDVGGHRVVVSKDIHTAFPVTPISLPAGPSLIARSGTLKAEASLGPEDDAMRIAAAAKDGAQKSDFTAKLDSADNLFMEDIILSISAHFPEGVIRWRFTEYAIRFLRLASRYEEEAFGSTKFGYPSSSFNEGPDGYGKLGSGIVFVDEALGLKELALNASRIEGWRRTDLYNYVTTDFTKALSQQAIQGFDVLHQLYRLRHNKNMPDPEVELIMRAFAENTETYEQVTELLAYLSPSGGGLLPLSYGLFHQQETVRELTVDLFNQLRAYPIGVLFLHSLNHFQRYAYVRQAHAQEARTQKDAQHLNLPTPGTGGLYANPNAAFGIKTPSNRSESSLAAVA
ncbi:hypothetical protein HWV62_12994 [Athelia sp. TMB]|nr:hypothetical protein HWV62_12994 [Athelia sp. TMB]